MILFFLACHQIIKIRSGNVNFQIFSFSIPALFPNLKPSSQYFPIYESLETIDYWRIDYWRIDFLHLEWNSDGKEWLVSWFFKDHSLHFFPKLMMIQIFVNEFLIVFGQNLSSEVYIFIFRLESLVSLDLLTLFQIWSWGFIILIWCQGFIFWIWSKASAFARCQGLFVKLRLGYFFIQKHAKKGI